MSKENIFKIVMITLFALGSMPARAMEKGELQLGVILQTAAYNGNLENVRACIEEGADVNAKDEKGRTALMWAALHGYEEIVECLMKAGSDLNSINRYGQTALMNAAFMNKRSICELLVEGMLGLSKQACAACFCLNNVEGNVFDGVKIPVAEHLSAPRSLGYEKTLKEVMKIKNNEIRNALLTKYFPNEVENKSREGI